MPSPCLKLPPLSPLSAERSADSGAYGWVAVQPAATMRLVSADKARDMLEAAFEGQGSRRRASLPVVLTSVDADGEEERS